MFERVASVVKKNERAGNKKLSLSEINMKYYIWNGILLSIVTSLYKPYAQKFLFRLNGTEFDITLFNSLPGLVALFTIIPGILIINRVRNKKRTIAISFISSRIFILTLAFVPFLSGQLAPIAFVILTSIMNFPDAVSTTALQSFTGDIFIGSQTSVAISDRNKYSTFINFVILIVLGLVMNKFGNTNNKTIEIYQILFIVAFVISIFEIASFYRLKEIKCSYEVKKESQNIWELLKEVKSNRKFMLFMACSMTFHFGWQMGWPLFSIYQIKYLGANELWLTILGVTSGISMFASFNFWKKLIINKGNSYTIAFATFGMAVTPILFALSPNLYVLTAAGLITGFFTAGTTTVIVSSLLEVSPQLNRDIYFGVHATLTSITLFISPFFGNAILSHSNVYIALCITSVFRFAGSISFIIRSKSIKS